MGITLRRVTIDAKGEIHRVGKDKIDFLPIDNMYYCKRNKYGICNGYAYYNIDKDLDDVAIPLFGENRKRTDKGPLFGSISTLETIESIKLR